MSRVKVLIGILLTATLFSISSCIINDSSIGTSFIPKDQYISLKTASFDLPIELRMADSLQASTPGSLMVGSISDFVFGTTRVSSSVTITTANDSIVWGKDPEVEEVYINFIKESTQYDKDDQEHILQNVYVYELNTPLDSSMYYCNSVTKDMYNPKPISLGASVYSGEDDFTIYLDPGFGEKFFKYSREQLDSAEFMVKHIYGLHVAVDDIPEGTDGGRLNLFDLNNSTLTIYYSYTNDDGERRTATAAFSLGSYWVVNTIESGSSRLATEKPDQYLYTDGLSGVKPYVNGKKLKKMVEQWIAKNNYDMDRFVIARASFELPFLYEEDKIGFYPSNIFICKREETTLSGRKYRFYTPWEEINDDDFSDGTINRSLFCYKPDACLYLQDLLDCDMSDVDFTDDIWFMPTFEYTNPSTGSTSHYADYQNYYRAILQGPKSYKFPKLVLTYGIIGEEE